MINTYYQDFAAGYVASVLANKLDLALNYKDLNIAIMGDSISAIAIPNQWIDVMLDRLAFKNVNRLAKSGATWSNTAGTVYDITITGGSSSDVNVIWNQFNILKAGVLATTMEIPDIIFCMAGTNDTSRTIGVPSTEFASGVTVLDKNVNTMTNITQAVRFTCENILAEWPYCQIILATPPQKGLPDNSVIFNIGDAIEGCGKYLGVSVIRTDKEAGIYGFNEYTQDIHLYDNIHPTPQGALNLGKLFTNKLRSIVLK